MGQYKFKKPLYLSKEEKLRNLAIVDAANAKFVKKNFKALATFKKEGSSLEYVSSGKFIDENDAKKFFLELLEEFKKIDNRWKHLRFEVLNAEDFIEEK